MRILFVCLGNICRSPTAEGVVRCLLEARGLGPRVEVDSCGIGDWHVGKTPDRRARDAAARRGIVLSALRARQLTDEDFARCDLLLAMDHDNLAAIEARRPDRSEVPARLLLDYAGYRDRAVPDPYFGGDQGFEEVLDLIEAAARGLVAELETHLESPS